MTKQDYKDELKHLEKYDISEEKKIRFIDNIYKLAHYNFNNFIKTNWQ